MPTKNKTARGPEALMPDELRLLSELALFGGVQIVRHGRDHIHYEALERKSLVGAAELNRNEIRYDITLSGRTLLAACHATMGL